MDSGESKSLKRVPRPTSEQAVLRSLAGEHAPKVGNFILDEASSIVGVLVAIEEDAYVISTYGPASVEVAAR